MTQKEYNCQECGGTIHFEGICHQCRGRKKREGHQSLSEPEIAEKIERIIAALDESFSSKNEFEDFFDLLAYRNISTEKIAAAAAKAGVHYPWAIYRNATPAVRETLIARLMDPKCKEANDLLNCLAIAGGTDVLAAFLRLEKEPLPWSKKLYAPPSIYAHAGGWTFDEEGNRIELNYGVCFPVLPGDKSADHAVLVASPRAETCPHCGSRLIDIMTLDGRDSRLAFLGLSGVLRIPLCPVCATMCERTIVRYELDGDSSMELVECFEDSNRMPEDEYAEMTAKNFTLAKQPESLFYAQGCNDFCGDYAMIGGFADWIQDPQYDACPDCGKHMRYFASVPWSALSDHSEGTLFLEICQDCRVISAFHQQT
ncbi:MAG: hypothetical protein LBU11_08795 [Zoogloeaceae bacterium]|nr:hypothetical protein [Zoogloeaceae bacterium]